MTANRVYLFIYLYRRLSRFASAKPSSKAAMLLLFLLSTSTHTLVSPTRAPTRAPTFPSFPTPAPHECCGQTSVQFECGSLTTAPTMNLGTAGKGQVFPAIYMQPKAVGDDIANLIWVDCKPEDAVNPPLFDLCVTGQFVGNDGHPTGTISSNCVHQGTPSTTCQSLSVEVPTTTAAMKWTSEIFCYNPAGTVECKTLCSHYVNYEPMPPTMPPTVTPNVTFTPTAAPSYLPNGDAGNGLAVSRAVATLGILGTLSLMLAAGVAVFTLISLQLKQSNSTWADIFRNACASTSGAKTGLSLPIIASDGQGGGGGGGAGWYGAAGGGGATLEVQGNLSFVDADDFMRRREPSIAPVPIRERGLGEGGVATESRAGASKAARKTQKTKQKKNKMAKANTPAGRRDIASQAADLLFGSFKKKEKVVAKSTTKQKQGAAQARAQANAALPQVGAGDGADDMLEQLQAQAQRGVNARGGVPRPSIAVHASTMAHMSSGSLSAAASFAQDDDFDFDSFDGGLPDSLASSPVGTPPKDGDVKSELADSNRDLFASLLG